MALPVHSRQRIHDRRPDGKGPSCKFLIVSSILVKCPAYLRGNEKQVSFDLLGASFAARKPVPSPRGPALRRDPLNFLTEITADDLKSYTPQQIKTILEQREKASTCPLFLRP